MPLYYTRIFCVCFGAWLLSACGSVGTGGSASASGGGSTPNASASGTGRGSGINSRTGALGAQGPNGYAPSNIAVTLDWLPPTENADGSTLTDLAGYKILYGQSPSGLNQSITLNGVGLTSYVITGLARGNWYFAILAFTPNGTRSALSNIESQHVD